MPKLLSQKVALTGDSEFLPIDNDYEYFVYEELVYCIQDFEDYEHYNMNYDHVSPIGTVQEFNNMEKDEREYYNSPNLYGPGDDIDLIWTDGSAILVTNVRGF